MVLLYVWIDPIRISETPWGISGRANSCPRRAKDREIKLEAPVVYPMRGFRGQLVQTGGPGSAMQIQDDPHEFLRLGFWASLRL